MRASERSLARNNMSSSTSNSPTTSSYGRTALVPPPTSVAARRRRRIMAMPRAMVTEGSTDEPLLAKEEALPYRFPKWWLFVQASFMLAPAVSNNLILPLLIPPRVAQLVGQERKATALGAVTALDRGISLTGPLLGALSDKISTPCGRRRPFILIGQGFILLGIWGLWVARSHLYEVFVRTSLHDRARFHDLIEKINICHQIFRKSCANFE